MLQMGVFEVFRIFQPIAEQPVEGNVAEPDETDGHQQRPLRTVPTPATKAALEPYNAMAAAMREGLAKAFGLPE